MKPHSQLSFIPFLIWANLVNNHQMSATSAIFWLLMALQSFALLHTRNPASRASKRARLVAMYIAVAIRPSSYSPDRQ